MARIYVVDSWNKFWHGPIKLWKRRGHHVRRTPHWQRDLFEWADVVVFHPCDNNVKAASRKQEKRDDQFVLVEAVDIDIYAGHPGGVEWDFVDALMFMSDHMRRFALDRFGQIPDSLPVYTVPGGVDLEEFTFREDRRVGHDVGWVGRLWIAKNFFGALQVFDGLVQRRPKEPWRLLIRDDDKYHPNNWWRLQCESYIEANGLSDRLVWTPYAEDMNEWYEQVDFLLQTSYKEAFSYCTGEAAAKGIKPIVQMSTGMLDIWPELVFQTHDEAIEEFTEYDPSEYRQLIVDKGYTVKDRVAAVDEITGL